MKIVNTTEENSRVYNGEIYHWIPEEQAWVKRDDLSMTGDFTGLVADTRDRWKLYWNGGISKVDR